MYDSHYNEYTIRLLASDRCWIQITSGRGPAECCRVVYRVVQYIAGQAEKKGLSFELLESVDGPFPETMRSALASIAGDSNAVSAFADRWNGSVQWVCRSMFRPGHRRRNWFAGAVVLRPAADEKWKMADIRIDCMRSSGPGGSTPTIRHPPCGSPIFPRD